MMIKKIIYTSITIAFLLGLVAGPVGAGVALAEDLPVQLPGVVEGVGTQFEVTDSAYRNVSLQSSETVSVYLSSVPSALELWLPSAVWFQDWNITCTWTAWRTTPPGSQMKPAPWHGRKTWLNHT